jgi:hypothetical protein
MRKPNLTQREYDIFDELGLERKGLKDLTKQNLSKDVKPLDTKD